MVVRLSFKYRQILRSGRERKSFCLWMYSCHGTTELDERGSKRDRRQLGLTIDVSRITHSRRSCILGTKFFITPLHLISWFLVRTMRSTSRQRILFSHHQFFASTPQLFFFWYIKLFFCVYSLESGSSICFQPSAFLILSCWNAFPLEAFLRPNWLSTWQRITHASRSAQYGNNCSSELPSQITCWRWSGIERTGGMHRVLYLTRTWR